MNLLETIENHNTYTFEKKDKSRYTKYLINSNIMNYYANKKLNHKNNSKMLLKTKKNLPLILERSSAFEVLFDYIEVLENTDESINEYISNQHIINSFKEVIEALFYELYFKDLFISTEIRFEKEIGHIEFFNNALKDYESIEGLSNEESLKTILNSYNTLKSPYNRIRNNLILMTIYFKDSVVEVMKSKWI